MKNLSFKKLLPHIIAVAVFLIVAVIFCKPALESGVVMQQSDVTQSQGMTQQSKEYKEKHGTYPLWNTTMFSGMPAYQILVEGPSSPIGYIDLLCQLYLPKPLNFFFLSCICFYFLCICLRINPYVGILGSLAFAYSTYTPIIAVAGHDTKLLALAYAPALIGSVILIFDKKYIPGFVFTALFAALHLGQNHQQISFYVLLIIGIMTLFYLAEWIKTKQVKHAALAISLTLTGALIGVLTNAVILFPVMDYAKYSKRGGQLVMNNKAVKSDDVVEKNKTVGLTKEYAFDWSYGKAETMSLLFPGVMGYGSYSSQRDGETNIFPELDDNSNLGNYFSDKLNISSSEAENLSGALYWGDQPFTMGPVYIGATICFLFVFGMFFLDRKHKWWIFTACLLAVFLAWGKNFAAFNYFLFDHLPFYNKFRTPSMALVIPQILFPLLAVLAVNKLIEGNYTDGFKKLKSAAIIMGVVFVVAGYLYTTFDYSKENKKRTEAINNLLSAPQNASSVAQMESINAQYPGTIDNQVYENLLNATKGDPEKARGAISALRKDRQTLFGKDILIALLFTALTIGFIALYIGKKINTAILVCALPLLTLADLLPTDTHYLNDKSFDSQDKYQTNEFPESDADRMILNDKDPNYRVFNEANGDPFQDAKTSYYHRSIGGYHPAKLGIYDDLMTYQLSGQPNPAVLDMLNTKYIIQKDQQGNEVAVQNPGALGNCWFVKGVKFVETPVDEMRSLDNFNPRDSAIINSSYKDIVTGFTAPDSSAYIKQTSFDNEDIKYESNSNTTNVAVFSEIFYKDWKAYIDGKETPIAKADYVLRTIVVPAGKHDIEFKFKPWVYYFSYTTGLISEWVLFLLLVLLLFRSFKQNKQ